MSGQPSGAQPAPDRRPGAAAPDRLRALARLALQGPTWVRWAVRRPGQLRLVRGRWRGSLQIRVVATTVLLGLLVVAGVGSFLLARISSGLVDSRRQSAENESAVVFQDATTFIQSYQATNDPGLLARDLVNRLAGPADAPLRIVVLLPSIRATGPTPVNGRSSNGLARSEINSVIPTALRQRVTDEPNHQPSTNVALPLTDAGASGATVPAVVVGTMVNLGPAAGGKYELYLIYRMDREVQVLQLVQRTFLVGGVLLVLLVAAVAMVVTRQVVAPVRQAASTAEELAFGHLDRRMKVRGNDDLARLGRAFNEMAESLERQIHRLEELSRVQRRFVSDVSHELRTPLTTIRMAGEVMYESRDGFDPAVARSAELLQAQLDRFETLLADLLEISRFDAGAAQLEVDPVDVREVVHRVVEGLGPLAERRGGRLVVQAPLIPCEAEIDARRAERIVRNLVGNAIEHGEGARVQIAVAADRDAVAVSVRDHGAGLSADDVAMVFNRFWRADPARARTTGGTGLGLAIALEDAHLHGGWLEVWGSPGEGANFRLTLPRRAGVVLTSSPLPLVPDDAGGLPSNLPAVASAVPGPILPWSQAGTGSPDERGEQTGGTAAGSTTAGVPEHHRAEQDVGHAG